MKEEKDTHCLYRIRLRVVWMLFFVDCWKNERKGLDVKISRNARKCKKQSKATSTTIRSRRSINARNVKLHSMRFQLKRKRCFAIFYSALFNGSRKSSWMHSSSNLIHSFFSLSLRWIWFMQVVFINLAIYLRAHRAFVRLQWKMCDIVLQGGGTEEILKGEKKSEL